jgi:hypothetical protein
MVHVRGAQAQQLAQATRGVDPAELVAVAIDVGSTRRWRWCATLVASCWPARLSSR